jgi:integrase
MGRGVVKTSVRGLGHVYRRGRVYWIKYSHLGTCYRESAQSRERGVAVRLLKDRLAAIASGRLLELRYLATNLADLVQLIEQDYRLKGHKSWRRAQANLRHLQPFFGSLSVRHINHASVRQYIARRRAEGAANATVAREVAILKRMLSLAAAEGRIPAVPKLPAISVQNARQGFFEPGQLEALLQHLGDKYAAMTRFAAITGWRKEEVRTLTWKQVDFAAGEVRLEVGATKNGRGRIFPFAASPALEALLKAQRDITTQVERAQGKIIPWVFHRNGVPVGVSWYKAWHRAAAKAGVPGRLFHDLRRTAVRNLVRAGVPERVAMELTGHLTRRVFDAYHIVPKQDLVEAVERLARAGRET